MRPEAARRSLPLAALAIVVGAAAASADEPVPTNEARRAATPTRATTAEAPSLAPETMARFERAGRAYMKANEAFATAPPEVLISTPAARKATSAQFDPWCASVHELAEITTNFRKDYETEARARNAPEDAVQQALTGIEQQGRTEVVRERLRLEGELCRVQSEMIAFLDEKDVTITGDTLEAGGDITQDEARLFSKLQAEHARLSGQLVQQAPPSGTAPPR